MSFGWTTPIPVARALLGLCLAGAATAQTESEQTRAHMGKIFEAMSFLLPLSLDEQKFQDPTRREQILEALALLDRSTAELERHGRGQDAAFSHLSRSLAIDARDIHERYEEGHLLEARFLIQALTETCVACHSRLRSDDSTLSERFVEKSAVSELPPEQRAKLEYATRQFDRALATYESLFASPASSPSDLDLMGDFDEYLELSVRVKGDLERPAKTLEKFVARPDLSPTLASETRSWIRSLRELQRRTPETSPLDDARAILKEAEDPERFSDERDALVHYLYASSLLHRLVASKPDGDPSVADAYYVLGVIETKIGRSFWLSEAEAYLETAIRLAPGQPVAENAYVLLEDYPVAGYTGSGGENVPPDIRAKLDELKALVD